MRLYHLLIVCLLVCTCWACNQTKGVSAEDDRSTTATSVATTPPVTGETFGASFTADRVLRYDDMLSQMNAADTLEAQVQGKVESVCQAKGCWMNITAERADAMDMMVKFKDYGFFMPKDIDGREVVMNGIAYYETTSVDELRHYAEDAGKSAEEIAQITEPKRELKFLADGVILVEDK